MADITALKAHVSKLANEPRFIHHQWFVVHHLAIIEQIIEELLPLYPQADATVTRSMVWVHDWGKILTNKGPEEDAVTHGEIYTRLPEWGYVFTEVAHIASVYEEMESLKPHAGDFLLETKLISSADALAHYIGPFFALYWYENPDKSVDALIADNLKKVVKDDKKLLLPEVRAAAAKRMAYLLENHPNHRPASYLQGA